MEDLFRASAKERQILGGKEKVVQISAQPKKTRDKLAKIAGVPHDTIAKVKIIEEKATPEVKFVGIWQTFQNPTNLPPNT